MSDYAAISAASQTLLELLQDHVTNSTDPQLRTVRIDLRSPREMRQANNATGISLWLYRVMRNPDTLNRPPARTAPEQQPRWPVPLDLYYLLTPIAREPRDEQTLLGRVVQVFNDHGLLAGASLRGSLLGTDAELRLTMDPLSLEDLTRIWNALQESYQLSISYQVQIITIESHHEPVVSSPVLERRNRYTQIVGVQ
jgi:hypothetical protein